MIGINSTIMRLGNKQLKKNDCNRNCKMLSLNELIVIGSLLVLVGDLILFYTSVGALCEDNNDENLHIEQ